MLPPPRACDSRAMCAARVCAGAVSIEAGKVDINLLSMAFFNEAKQRGSPFFVDEMVEAAMVYQLDEVLSLPMPLRGGGRQGGLR